MAKKALVQHELSMRQSCRAFGISETCYRYEAKLSDENAEIADWLLRLTAWQRNWGLGLCFFVSAQRERLRLEP
jgi:putative transposase